MGIQDDKSPDQQAALEHAEATEQLDERLDQLPQAYRAHGEDPPDAGPTTETNPLRKPK